MAYTKGEWILDFSEEHNGTINIYVPGKGIVAKIFTRSCDDNKANAQLIVLSPRLYEITKYALLCITKPEGHKLEAIKDAMEQVLAEGGVRE